MEEPRGCAAILLVDALLWVLIFVVAAIIATKVLP